MGKNVKIIAATAACTIIFYPLSATSQSAAPSHTHIYSSYADRIPGTFALYVDVEELVKSTHTTGQSCSWRFDTVDLRNQFRSTAIQTMSTVVEKVELVERPMTPGELQRAHLRGQIIIRAESISTDVKDDLTNFIIYRDRGVVNLSAGILVDGPNGRLLGALATGTGSGDAYQGLLCGGGAATMAQAGQIAIDQLFNELAERLSNSERVRAEIGSAPPAPAAPTVEALQPRVSGAPRCDANGLKLLVPSSSQPACSALER